MNRVMVYGGVALVVLAVSGYVFLSDEEEVNLDQVGVFTYVDKVSRGDLNLVVSSNGVVDPINKVEIKSKASGRVEQLRFIEEARIPVSMTGMLQALPKTPLHARMKREGRLVTESGGDQLESFGGEAAMDEGQVPHVAHQHREPLGRDATLEAHVEAELAPEGHEATQLGFRQ